MSAILIIQKEQELYFGTDTAISTTINNNLYRINEDGKKIWIINDKLIFCSGNMSIANELMTQYINYKNKSIQTLKELAIELYNNKDMLEVIVGGYESGRTVVYQISSYNDFEIVKRNVCGDEIGLWTGGIKTNECFDFAYEQIKNKIDLFNIYQNTFDSISFEGIGGKLNVYKLDKTNIELVYKNDVVEKNIKRVVIGDRHLVYAETIIGKLIIGEKLVIESSDGIIKINGSAMTVYDADKVSKRVILGDISDLEDGSKYGLKLINDSGVTVISEGIVQSDTIMHSDNVDSSHKLSLKIHVPDDVLEVRSVKLAFSLENFRTYETGASSAGSSTITSTSGGSSTPTSSSGGASTPTSSTTTAVTKSSTGAEWGPADDIATTGMVSYEGDHFHNVSIFNFNHVHNTDIPSHNHSVSVPSHNHSVSVPSHDHSVSVPSHTHGMVYAIYEGSKAQNVDIYVDGVFRNGSFNTDQNNIELSSFITTSGWHTLELSSTTLGRISASLHIKSYVAL